MTNRVPHVVEEDVTAAGQLFESMCPTQTAEEAMQRIVREMWAAGESPLTITRTILSAILDGLNHGNWPK